MVRLFTTPTCPFCMSLKKFLEERGIEFQLIDVSSDLEAQKEMIEKTKQQTVPVIDINGEFVVGFDRRNLRIIKHKRLKR